MYHIMYVWLNRFEIEGDSYPKIVGISLIPFAVIVGEYLGHGVTSLSLRTRITFLG